MFFLWLNHWCADSLKLHNAEHLFQTFFFHFFSQEPCSSIAHSPSNIDGYSMWQMWGSNRVLGSQIVASHIIKKGIKNRSVVLVLIMRPSLAFLAVLPCKAITQAPLSPIAATTRSLRKCRARSSRTFHWPLPVGCSRYCTPNLIRPSYAIKLSGRKSKCNAGSRLSSAKSAGTHPATETSCERAHDAKVRPWFSSAEHSWMRTYKRCTKNSKTALLLWTQIYHESKKKNWM